MQVPSLRNEWVPGDSWIADVNVEKRPDVLCRRASMRASEDFGRRCIGVIVRRGLCRGEDRGGHGGEAPAVACEVVHQVSLHRTQQWNTGMRTRTRKGGCQVTVHKNKKNVSSLAGGCVSESLNQSTVSSRS